MSAPLEALGVRIPIVQAPMAGVSTPAMAAAVSEAGGLGSIAVGAVDAVAAQAMIAATRAQTDRAFNVNLFVHRPPRPDDARERLWLAAMDPLFARFDAAPPAALETIYRSFADDDAMLAMLLEAPPPAISFHFGLPDAARIDALRRAGCVLLATATSLAEARAIEAAGLDIIVAQGWEAGGHRGTFDPAARDERLDTMTLTRLLAGNCRLPIIAAGGIMDGAGVRTTLSAGAVAAQVGTAFIACPESSASPAYRAALLGGSARATEMVAAISGRPARCLANRFTQWAATTSLDPPDYPRAYHAGKALDAAARAAGEHGFGAQWAGQGAALARAIPAAALVETLWREARPDAAAARC